MFGYSMAAVAVILSGVLTWRAMQTGTPRIRLGLGLAVLGMLMMGAVQFMAQYAADATGREIASIRAEQAQLSTELNDGKQKTAEQIADYRSRIASLKARINALAK